MEAAAWGVVPAWSVLSGPDRRANMSLEFFAYCKTKPEDEAVALETLDFSDL